MKKNKLDPKFDQLMAPRFRVISNYPDTQFKLNSVIKFKIATKRFNRLYGDKYTYENKHSYYEVAFFEKYPAIFRPILFWEDRKPEDFPVPFYVRSETNNVFKISSVSKRTDGISGLFFDDGVHCGGFAIYMTKEMISEEEYNRAKEFSSCIRSSHNKFGVKQYQQK